MNLVSETRRDAARGVAIGLAFIAALLLFLGLRLFQWTAALLYLASAVGLIRSQRWAAPLGIGVSLFSLGLATLDGLLALSRSGLPGLILPASWAFASVGFLVMLGVSAPAKDP